MSSRNGTDKLVGKTIRGVSLSDNGETLTFDTADGPITGEAYGDCCSKSWIEHITIPPNLNGAIITEVRDLYDGEATPEQYADARAKHDYVDVLKAYQTAFVTDRGEIVVEYRNDSNGYYGGWLQF